MLYDIKYIFCIIIFSFFNSVKELIEKKMEKRYHE